MQENTISQENNARKYAKISHYAFIAHAFNVQVAIQYGIHIAIIYEAIERINAMGSYDDDYHKNIPLADRLMSNLPYFTKSEIKRALRKMNVLGMIGGENE